MSGARLRLWALGAVAYAAGLYLRWDYLYVTHAPTKYISSDMLRWVRAAQRFYDPRYTQTIEDSLHPPGYPYFLGLLHKLDPSWGLAIAAAFVLSAVVPLLCGLIAFDLFGTRAAIVSVVLASLYWPFVDYAGYFLSEGPFLFAMVLAMAALVRALRVSSEGAAFGLALLAGCALGSAAATKSVALLAGAAVGAALVVLAWRYRWRRVMRIAPALAAGLALVLVPTAMRCTRLQEGRFCLLGRETGMNVFLGHQGRIHSAKFLDRERGVEQLYGCPAAHQKGYTSVLTVEHGPYESEKLVGLAWNWTRENPLDSLLLSIEHLFDNFIGSIPWPSSHSLQHRWAIFFQQVHHVFLLVPALFLLFTLRRRIVTLAPGGIGPLLLVLPLVGLLAASFIARGEPRYRIPFDGFTIVLAAALYAGGGDRADPFHLGGREPEIS